MNASTAALPDGWTRTTLEAVLTGPGELTYGIVQPGAHDPDGVPIVRVTDVRNGRVTVESPMRVGSAVAASFQRSKLQGGELLITLVGTVGECAVVPDMMRGWNTARAVGVARIKPDVGADWVALCLRSRDAQERIAARVNTKVQTTLNLKDVRELPIVLPRAAELRRIRMFVAALDDKIDSNRRTIDTCSGLLDATSSSLALELDSVPLSGLATPLRDAFDPSALGDERIDHFSIPAFDAKGLPDRTSGTSVISAKLRVDQPSVLLSRLNPATNRTWFAVPEPDVTAGCSTEFLVLTPTAGVTLGSLWLAVRDEGFRSLLVQQATGTSGSHQRVKAQDALATEVPDIRQLPAVEAQAADELLWLIHQRRVESTRLGVLRDALLPELLSGRIGVPEAGEAVESALV